VPFEAPDLTPSQMDFGGVGLMQMPTARMSDEGEFNFSVTGSNEYLFYNVTLQVLPWLESTIRYTKVRDLPYSSSFPGVDNDYTDKGIDFKIRLMQESQYLPELSVGVRDFAGTGLFDAEFIAATKRYSNPNLGTFDFTLGMGWGYLGTRDNVTNPFCKLGDKFCERSDEFLDSGGTTNFERAFKGPAALFGGVEFQTLHEPLRFKIEYDSNDYSEDYAVVRSEVDMTPHTPWNFGVLYRLGHMADLRLSYERGDTLVAGVSLYTNFNEMPSFWRDTPTPEMNDEQPEQLSDVDWERVTKELDNVAGYQNAQLYVSENTVSVVGEQKKYRDRTEAHEKASAVLYNEMPENINTFTINERSRGLIGEQTVISKDKYRDFAEVNYVDPVISDATSTSGMKPQGDLAYDGFERFDWGF
ncbi:YjbH domain-containing protein, partial [Vibrio diabolicus]|uniref:YjbH domain-containing protein n=3 Tax=Vibrio TaxID=662 RepID=UPI00211B4BAF